MFGTIWGLAVVGIIVDSLHKKGSRAIQMAIYLLMGWLILVAMHPLIQALPRTSWYCWYSAACSTPAVLFFMSSMQE